MCECARSYSECDLVDSAIIIDAPDCIIIQGCVYCLVVHVSSYYSPSQRNLSVRPPKRGLSNQFICLHFLVNRCDRVNRFSSDHPKHFALICDNWYLT